MSATVRAATPPLYLRVYVPRKGATVKSRVRVLVQDGREDSDGHVHVLFVPCALLRWNSEFAFPLRERELVSWGVVPVKCAVSSVQGFVWVMAAHDEKEISPWLPVPLEAVGTVEEDFTALRALYSLYCAPNVAPHTITLPRGVVKGSP